VVPATRWADTPLKSDPADWATAKAGGPAACGGGSTLWASSRISSVAAWQTFTIARASARCLAGSSSR
jgi:hypothetical protein